MLGSCAFFPRGRAVGSRLGECVRSLVVLCPPDKLFSFGGLPGELFGQSTSHDLAHSRGQCIHVTGH